MYVCVCVTSVYKSVCMGRCVLHKEADNPKQKQIAIMERMGLGVRHSLVQILGML